MEKFGFKYTVEISRWDIGDFLTELKIQDVDGKSIKFPIFGDIEESLKHVATIIESMDGNGVGYV